MWKKRDELKTIEEIVKRNTGLPLEQAMEPCICTEIVNMEKAADVVREVVEQKQPVTIIGDYDVDGITGAAILYLLFKLLGVTANVRLPKRFSEGYGISKSMLDGIDSGLLITVDNGITAVEELAAAKAKGLTVVVLDHHKPRDDGALPEADVLVDPHVFGCGDFEGFCGAGLAYRLARNILDDETQLEPLCALAALGTIADVVPLIHDNRYMVINGLHFLNKGRAPKGLLTLAEQLNLFDVDEGDVSYTIAPILNAAGRMYDDGAMRSFKLLTETSNLDKLAEELIKTNIERKAAQSSGLQAVEEMITANCMFGDPIMLVYSGDDETEIPEGVAGILAGRLADKYQIPAFVLTKSGVPGVLKGSGRSYGGKDIKALLDKASHLLEGHGGHPKAAGLSVKEENVEKLRSFLVEQMAELPCSAGNDDLYYDLEVDAEELPELIAKIQKYAPYGEGNARPIILVHNQRLIPRQRRFHTYMGEDDQHVKLYCGNKLAAVGFGLAKKYTSCGEPISLDIIGSIFVNKYTDPIGRRLRETQVRIEDFQKPKVVAFASPLTISLQAKLKALGGK